MARGLATPPSLVHVHRSTSLLVATDGASYDDPGLDTMCENFSVVRLERETDSEGDHEGGWWTEHQ
jgi:hypothetical protein